MLLRLERISLPLEHLERPIPSLSDRQFVVSKTQHSADDQRTTRELFWYRQELQKRVKATWNEVRCRGKLVCLRLLTQIVAQVGSLRTGSISLRGLQLTKPMLDVLRGDDVDIQLHLDDNSASDAGAFQLKGRGQRLVYTAAANEFIDICALIENLSRERAGVSIPCLELTRAAPTASPIDLTLRLELRPPESSRATPAALAHLARYVIIEGVSPVTVRQLGPGDSETVRVSMCLLAEGTYELGCVAEEARRTEGMSSSNTYGAREPLVVHVQS